MNVDQELINDLGKAYLNSITEGSSKLTALREEKLGLARHQEPERIKFYFTLPNETNADRMCNVLDEIAQRRYKGLEKEVYGITSQEGDTDLLFPGHYTIYIEKIYMFSGGDTILVMFQRKPGNYDRAALKQEAEQIFNNIVTKLEKT